MKKKAKKVMARLSFTDIIVPIEDAGKIFYNSDALVVNYEDEDGEECDEDGEYD